MGKSRTDLTHEDRWFIGELASEHYQKVAELELAKAQFWQAYYREFKAKHEGDKKRARKYYRIRVAIRQVALELAEDLDGFSLGDIAEKFDISSNYFASTTRLYERDKNGGE